MQNQTRNSVIVALIAALVVVTCWKQSPGQGEAAKPAAVKWEYRVEYVNAVSSGKTVRDDLNRLGDDGWEVCAAFAPGQLVNGSGTSDGRVVLKRLKAEK